MVWVLVPPDNLGQNKHVESADVPCLDEGSNPSISTKMEVVICKNNPSISTRLVLLHMKRAADEAAFFVVDVWGESPKGSQPKLKASICFDF